MNTTTAPFDNPDARRALSFALDRGSGAGKTGIATCQMLPPGWPGYAPYCPYTALSDAGGQWKGPDIERAKQLVAQSGTAGAEITIGPAQPSFHDTLTALGDVLGELGYNVVGIDYDTDFDHYGEAVGDSQISVNAWLWDMLSPSVFMRLFQCDGDPLLNYCDATGYFDRTFDAAQQLQTTDRAAATRTWTELDHWVVDQAIVAPLHTDGVDFVGPTVGNYQASPGGYPLLDQLWVR